MKWFKHDSDAGNDAKLRKLRIKYGAQGYGIYWYCLELIARNVEKHNLTFELEHDAELIAEDFRLSGELVQEMMVYMVNLGLFENTQGVITCLKMASRTDEYTQQLMREMKITPDNIPRKSKNIPRISEVTEENRKEKNKTSIPKNFSISENVKAWAKEKNVHNLDKHYESFIDKCKANGYKYVDWDRAFMNAIRDNWAKIDNKNPNVPRLSV